MEDKKTVGVVLLVVGIVLLILSLAADLVGIGGWPGFGWGQILGTVIGVIGAIVGSILALKK